MDINIFKKIWFDPVGSKVIAGIIGALLFSFYSLLKKVNYLEFSFLDSCLYGFALILLILLIYGVLKIINESKNLNNINSILIANKEEKSENIKCTIYTNLPPNYKITNINNKLKIKFEGYCKITNISNIKIEITSVYFKNNYPGVFTIWDSGGNNIILPKIVTTIKFWVTLILLCSI